MRKIFILPVIAILVMLFTGCEKDESLDPRPVIVDGQFMRLDITSPKIDFNNLSTSSFGGMLTNPSNNVVKYEMLVKILRAYQAPSANNGNIEVVPIESVYIPFRTITAFPLNLSITAQDVVEAFATAEPPITIDVKKGDEYYFIAYSYDALGNKVVYRDLSLTVRGEPAYKQAYKFNTLVTDNLGGDYSNYKP